MSNGPSLPALQDRWHDGVVLKRDVFSTVERGRFLAAGVAPVDAILRRLDEVPWWSRPLARHLFQRERRALTATRGLSALVGPALLEEGPDYLVRSFIDGVALHVAKPHGDVDYFRSAKQLLRTLHRAGVCHNDLAKEQNWLRGRDGKAYVTDFQLAFLFRRRSRLFRLAAYEDLRHLLKHKRKYIPQALTPSELKVLARKSWPTRFWMATGKRVYRGVTRGVFGFVDREGGGPRLVYDGPAIVEHLEAQLSVTRATVVAFPDRRAGVGLYAFVEASEASEAELLSVLNAALGPARLPEHLQVVARLPADAMGAVRTEILQLVAMNQIDLIDPLISDETERALVNKIVADRRNLRDRFNFQTG